VVCNAKYADDLILLAKEEVVLKDMTERQTEIGRCYGIEINMENKGEENFKAPIPKRDYDR
jgi:ABC-type hemin transport system ATPase subunit